MRLSEADHTSRPWRIHELVPDFRVEDVWAMPWHGERGDFDALVRMVSSQDVSRSSSRAVRTLFAIRMRLGQLLGWDGRQAGAGSAAQSLLQRLPADLSQARGPRFAALPFMSLYLLEDEFAAETANRTMHGVLHVGWVPDEAGGYRGQMAVLVRPNGRFGRAYMAAIKPFRHLIVYPALMAQIERAWRRHSAAQSRPLTSG